MVKFEKFDADGINKRLLLEDEVVCPEGTYILWGTIIVPSGKRLRGHPDGTTILMAFDGPAIYVETPAVDDAVTGMCVGESPEVKRLAKLEGDRQEERIADLPFPKARRTMAKALRDDAGLRNGYVSNIAMLLHDYYGITDRNKRNEAAAAILTLIFESK